MPIFEPDGSEAKWEPDPNAEVILECGGIVDETAITLSVYSETLDRKRVTKILGVEPTRAWNPGERHPYGYRGRTRIVDWGKWFLSTEHDETPIDEKLASFFRLFTEDLNTWKLLATEYQTWLTISGHFERWNQELLISPEIVKLIADRSLALHLDFYFYGDEE